MNPEPIRYGIKQETWDRIIAVLRSHPAVESIILFGSRAKGNFRNGSDIDLCLNGANLTEQDINALSIALDDLNLPWEIDLLRYMGVKDPAVIEHIDRVGIVL